MNIHSSKKDIEMMSKHMRNKSSRRFILKFTVEIVSSMLEWLKIKKKKEIFGSEGTGKRKTHILLV